MIVTLLFPEIPIMEELPNRLPLQGLAPIRQNPQTRTEFPNFLLPIMQSARWRNHEKRTPDFLIP